MNFYKKYFSEEEFQLIKNISLHGRKTKKGEKLTWAFLEKIHNIRPYISDKKGGKKANDIWRRYIKLKKKFGEYEITKETYKDGEIVFSTIKKKPTGSIKPTDNFEIDKITTSPYGGQWISYKKTVDIVEKLNLESTINKLLKKHFDANKVNDFTFESKESEDDFTFGSANIAIVNLFDAHIDKIPIYSETLKSSSLNHNIKVFMSTIYDIVAQLRKEENITKIIFPVGNDLFHTNGFNKGKTKKGTQIEYYGSEADAYYAISNLIIETIKLLATVAEVEVIMIKGNHDEDKIITLGFLLNKFFDVFKYPDYHKVKVDFLRTQRKYIKFGENLIGFAHGDKEKSKIAQLPLLMATEAKELWGQTTHRKMYLGDLHHGFQYNFLKAKDMPGVEIEYLRSVGTTDTWHEDWGWIGVPKTAYLFIINESEGEIVRRKFNIK